MQLLGEQDFNYFTAENSCFFFEAFQVRTEIKKKSRYTLIYSNLKIKVMETLIFN